jgi:glyoxylase-like metal-dependent hydrolase (beta-lactamase superfamily II)
MRKTTVAASLLVVAALYPLARLRAQAEPDFSKIEVKVEKAAGNVYMLSGVGGFAGGNVGVSVGPDGVLLVDDQFEPMVPKIEAALKGVTDKPVRFVLNTHYHGDHTHGNKVFGLRATVIAHDNVRKRMAASDEFDGKPGTKPPAHALPLVTFDDQVSVHLNGEEIRGVHFPSSHTDTDTVVYFKGSNVVHMGDDYFNGAFPYVDLEGGGSVKGYLAAIEGVLGQVPDDVKVIPGHGPLATKADMRAYLDMLKETTAIVEKALAQGKTAEELKTAKVLGAFDAKWGGGFIKTDAWIDTIAKSLQGAAKKP